MLKKRLMLFALLVLMNVITAVASRIKQDSQQYAVAVFGAGCLHIDIEHAQYIAPMINGEPDTRHGWFEGVRAFALSPNCAIVEIRHK